MQIRSTSIIPHLPVTGPGTERPQTHRPAEQKDQSGKNASVSNALNLDQSQLRQVEKLRQRDREVRNHEMAHLAAAGAYALGGPTFEYQKGPDGQRYAIGGHVNIDTSPVPGDPEATLRKAETIRRAALAPGDPSPQDRSVAAAASAMAIKAQIEIQQRPDQNASGSARNRSQDPETASDRYRAGLDDESSAQKLDLLA